MKHKKLRWLVLLGTFLLTGLMIIQVYWLQKAFSVANQTFDHSVQVALKDVVDHVNDTTPIQNKVKKLSSEYYLVETSGLINPEAVSSQLLQALNKREIEIPFELGFYLSEDDSLIYAIDAGNILSKNERTSLATASPQLDIHKITLFFPSNSPFLAGEMEIWIYSTALVMLMVVFFGYAIFSLLREKQFSQMKTDFFSNITHELKMPVTNIQIATEILSNKIKEDPIAQQYLKIIYQENSTLGSKIEQVLQKTKYESIDKEANEPIDIHKLLTDTVDNFQLKIQQRKGNITLSLNAQQAIINGQKEQLIEVFNNLLDNAEKYSHCQPNIEICTQDTSSGLQIVIKDQGIGIPNKFQQKIFEKFFRVPTGNQHDVKGFGLGLAFVKSVIKKHSGKISLQSQPMQGTSISLSFQTI